MLFSMLLSRVVHHGSLTVVSANGRRRDFGDGTGRPVTVRLHDKTVAHELALNPYMNLGEAYMDGRMTVDPPATIYDLLDVLTGNLGTKFAGPAFEIYGALRRAKRRIDQHNPIGKAQKNVAHHYDLDGGIYDLFLDRDKQYSCAYFQRPDMTLEEAQLAKKRHIAAKLRIEPGMRVLDIGCGWGGMALHLAKEADCDVTGITLSERQHAVATRRAEEAGLSHRVRFHLRDYREETDRYDRIVSVGMFEHVGALHHRQFFAKVKELLTDDGVALLHSIGRMEPPGSTNAWIRKYIFPGGYSPALSETLAAVERTGLWVTDMEILRLHYAKTLAEWKRRFDRNREEIQRLYDERFVRMWEFYLLACESSFLYWRQMVFQLQLSKKLNAVPLTRDYMVDRERERMAA